MPGVILSLDQWTIFGDTGLGERAMEKGGKCSAALLWRETPGPGRAAWAPCLDPLAQAIAGHLEALSAE